MKNLRITWLLLTCLAGIFTGCRGPDVATGIAKAKAQAVAVDSHVPSYGIRLGLQSGGTHGLALAIVNKMYAGRVQAIEEAMQKASINVPEMVRNEFVKQLQSRSLVKIVNENENPDAVFQIEIRQHGFNEYPPFTSNELPFLDLACRLVDRSENTVWKSSSLQAKRGYPGMGGSLADYTDPEKLKKDWETQIRIAVEYILEPRSTASGEASK